MFGLLGSGVRVRLEKPRGIWVCWKVPDVVIKGFLSQPVDFGLSEVG